MSERYEIVKAMHTIIKSMNNENAYMRWIYIVPDEASNEDLMDIAQSDELFADTCNAFKSIFTDCKAGGLYVDKKVW